MGCSDDLLEVLVPFVNVGGGAEGGVIDDDVGDFDGGTEDGGIVDDVGSAVLVGVYDKEGTGHTGTLGSVSVLSLEDAGTVEGAFGVLLV